MRVWPGSEYRLTKRENKMVVFGQLTGHMVARLVKDTDLGFNLVRIRPKCNSAAPDHNKMSSHTNNLVRLAAAILSRQQQLRSPLAGAAGAAVRASSAASLQGADSLPVVQHRRQLACAAADACWQQWRVSSTATSCRTLWTQPQNKGRCFSRCGGGFSTVQTSGTTAARLCTHTPEAWPLY